MSMAYMLTSPTPALLLQTRPGNRPLRNFDLAYRGSQLSRLLACGGALNPTVSDNSSSTLVSEALSIVQI
jgi:hypothetical protein